MQFEEGQKIKSIMFENGETISSKNSPKENISISVSMEAGQYSGVPWFEVYKNGKLISKWNGALLLGVEVI